jgi:hypothetical protein
VPDDIGSGSGFPSGVSSHVVAAQVELKATLKQNERSLSYFSFRRLVPGAFNVGLISQVNMHRPTTS